MKDHKAYTSAAKLIADLLDDPSIEREVKEKLARRKRINALVSERAKANLSIQEVAKRMGITYRQLHDIEETWEDKDLQDFPKVVAAYTKAIRRTKKKGGAKCEKRMRYCKACAREVKEIRERRRGNYFQTTPSGGAPEARKSRRQERKPTPAN